MRKEHTNITKQLMNLLDGDRRLRSLVEKSIDLAAKENPDEKKNPVRSLRMLFDYIDFTQTVMPWAYLPEECFKNFVTKTDQSCLYLYYLLDRPLKELEEDGLVTRKQYEEMPVRVEYSLTEKGRSLWPIIHRLGHWARGEEFDG